MGPSVGHVTTAGGHDGRPLPALARRRPRVGSASVAAAGAIAGSVVLAVLLRIPFLSTGLSPDEGGYAYVASQWARGARLYGTDWVDRPQGLLVAYRLLLDVGHSAWAIRLGALLFAAGITVLLGVAGWLLAGPRAGAVAAVVYAVVGVAPHLQGFTFNGELVASLPVTGCVVASLAWRRDGRARWLVAAGAAAGLGVLMKQSAFDGLVVALAVALAGGHGARRRLANASVLAAGAAIPLGASAIHGALTGWGDYWFAVVGYKLSAPSGASVDVTSRLGALGTSWLGARRDLGTIVLVVLALVALAVAQRKRIWLPALWLGAAFIGMNAASLYWPHYYVQLLPPLALLVAVGGASLPGRLLPLGVVALVVVPALLELRHLQQLSPPARQRVIPYYGQFVRDQRVATEVDRLTRPGQAIYALDSEADLYFIADRPAPFRYLWGHPLEEVPGALGQLRSLLSGARRPRLVVVFRSAPLVDSSGKLARILARDYRPLEIVPGTNVPILQRT